MVAIDLVLNPTVDGVSRCGRITGKPEARVKWRNQAITLRTGIVSVMAMYANRQTALFLRPYHLRWIAWQS